MLQKKKLTVIAKEDAVFWMGKNGNWYNKHGKFEHPKIIKYFNAAIKKDENGYYVHQTTRDYEEKVYFSYEDTAIFVIDVNVNDDILVVLNTTDTMKLNPEKLFVRNDNLFLQTPEHLIKFTDRALLKISKFIDEKEGQLLLEIKGRTYQL